MTNAEETIKILQDQVSSIRKNTDWNTKGMPPDALVKMVEVSGAFTRLAKKLEETRIIFAEFSKQLNEVEEIVNANNGEQKEERK